MQTLPLDIRYALCGFRKSPAFTLVTVLSLALAIGANGFVFGVLNTVVLRPFEVRDPQNLHQIRYGPRKSGSNLTTSYPAFRDLRQRNTTFSDMIGIYAYSEASLGGRDAGPRLRGVAVSGNYFDMLEVQPQAGRLFHAADERGLNSAPYVVLSDALWRRVFDGDPGVVGTTVRLNERPFTAIGVAAAPFHGTERFWWPDYWIPIVNEDGPDLRSREERAVTVIGRLKPGVTPQQAAADLNAITAQLAKDYPKTDKAVSVRLIRPGLMGDDGEGIRRFLYSVNVLALLLLAAVCVNLASAFAARAADRSRELAIRVALGSSRLRLARQLLTEALVITVIGGGAGLTSARVLLAALNRWPAALGSGYERLDLDLDPRVYVVGLALTVASALLIGMVPARQAWAGSPLQMIKNGLAEPARRWFSLRDVLLVVQIATCTLLVTASLVAARGMLRALDGSSAGIRPQGVMLATTVLPEGLEGDRALEAQKEMIEAVRSLPGMTAVGAVRETPMSWPRRVIPVYRPGTTEFAPENQALTSHVYPMSPDYLKAAGTRLLVGRDVSWQDTLKTPCVAIVNETFARTMWGEIPAVGQQFILRERLTEVVGVVEDGRYHNLMESPEAAAFVPLAQDAASEVVLVVRSSLAPTEVATTLRHTLGRVQPTVRVTLRTWPEALERVLYPARAAAFALGVMGLFAVMLAVTGIFGTAAHTVSRRVRELGIRVALGACDAQVVFAAVGRPTVLLGVGSVMGLLAAIFSSHLLGRIVYQADPSNPAVLVGAVLTMALIGIFGSAIPALRALAVDPSSLMRDE
jgi:predicted permease